MQFGMPTLIEHENLEETASLCHELGLDFVELNMNFPQYRIESLEDTDTLLAIAKKYQLFYMIHLDENLNVCDFNQAVTKAYLDTVKRTIAVAKKIKAPLINMHMNHGIYITLPTKKVFLYEEYKEHYLKSIEEFIHLC